MTDSGEFRTPESSDLMAVVNRIDGRLNDIQSDLSNIKIDSAQSSATANGERATLRRDVDKLDREKAHRDDVMEVRRQHERYENAQKEQRTFALKAASIIATAAGVIFSFISWVLNHLTGTAQ